MEQLLAWRGIPPRRIIVHATVARVHAIDDDISKRPAALDDSPAHEADIAKVLASAATPPKRVTIKKKKQRGGMHALLQDKA
jgi:hypothetical protein